ncbi:MAG TPA: lipocalin family protein [Ignavibacteriaceae bacterium]
MKTYLIIITLFSALMVLAQNESREPVTVDKVILTRYTGLWYEIAKIPNSFQKKCISSSTALYSLNEDGTIKVMNSCRNKEKEKSTTEGVARVVDTKTNSKLEVSFVSIFGIHLFWGDYWIIGLDDEYSYAVIGTPDRKYGWILSRTKQLSQEKLSAAYDILKKNGYNPKDFVATIQE